MRQFKKMCVKFYTPVLEIQAAHKLEQTKDKNFKINSK